MKIKLILIQFFLSGFIYGQSDSLKTFHIDNFKIKAVTELRQSSVLQKRSVVYNDLNIVSIIQDTFTFSTNGNLNIQKFTGKEINTISIKDGNYLIPAAGYSALGGFAVGFVIGSLTKEGNGEGHPSISFGEGYQLGLVLGLLLGVASGIVGGILGSMTPYYTDFDLSKNGSENNTEELKNIIEKYMNR